MSIASEVIQQLSPGCLYTRTGETYDDIKFLSDNVPFTKEQYDEKYANYPVWKAQQDAAKAQAKAALLERLGLSQEEFNTLIA